MRASTVVATAVLLGAAAGVATLQPRLAKTAHGVKENGDVYALPPPAELHAATLGWDAAAVDLLWANLLVAYGTHWAEHRDFVDVPKYVDAILELEPDFFPVYKFVDTMLVYRPMQGTEADARRARAYLERGTRERPTDATVWMKYGQFVAFAGPSFLKDQAEREGWRKDGAVAIGHAVELGADADRALTAASILTQTGQRDAAIRYLESAYAFTEHPSMAEVHQAIGEHLAALQAGAQRDAADDVRSRIDARWQAELPAVSRDEYLLLGPGTDVFACSGLDGYGDAPCERAECCRDWSSVLAAPAP